MPLVNRVIVNSKEGQNALMQISSVLDFVDWFDPLIPGEGIHKLAEELGIPIDIVKGSIIGTIRKRITQRKGMRCRMTPTA